MSAPSAVLLARTSLFGALPKDDLASVALELKPQSFPAGRTIFMRGDASHDIYFVEEGRVRLGVLGPDGRALAFRHATAGDIFGEIAAIDGRPRSADATALTDVRAWTLSRSALRRLMAARPLVAEAALSYVCTRLRETSEQLEELVLSPVDVRLARFLFHIATARDPAAPTVALNIGISQGELAILLGTRRQSVNTALSSLVRQGALRRVGSGLECNVQRLRLAAELE